MNKNEYDISKLSESEAWLMLYFLCKGADEEADRLIHEFETELIYKNRFSSNHVVVDELHKYAPYVSKEVKAGTILYRARVFHEKGLDRLVKYYLREQGSSPKEIKDILSNWSEDSKSLLFAPMACMDDKDFPNLFKNKQFLEHTLKKWRRNVRFKGYNANESTAPNANKVGEGRANPDHIRYLYLSEDVFTPIYEVRPSIDDDVSVAEFKLTKDIKLYNLARGSTQTPEVEGSIPCLFDAISALYSRPYKGKEDNYIATQFLAEEIKRMGFDGLRFESSLHKGGYNVVLFDPEICKAISSELAHINDIELKIDMPWYHLLDRE